MRSAAKFSNKTFKTTTMLSGAFIFATALQANALPTGGNVVGGQANINTNGSVVNVNQASNRAVINWNNFDVGTNEQVNFNQPSSSAVTLNRVINSQSPSQIYGKINANGTAMIVNTQGVLFGKGAEVNVGGLVATNVDIKDQDFMQGQYKFTKAGNPNAVIQNDGTIKIKESGLALLVGPNVVNNGLIEAKLGRVQLASGDSYTVDLYGDGLLNLQASKELNQQLVKNSGKIKANGGSVLLTTAAAENTVNSLINMDGLIEANGVGRKSGKVVLLGKSNGSKSSKVIVSGKITTNGQTGGEVNVLGDRIALESGALIDASGTNGGGQVLVGGDYKGQGSVQNALDVFMDNAATILANAEKNGKGGKVILWADNATTFNGRICAKGGKNSGNGGFVETSGKNILNIDGEVDASAPKGIAGTWLLDPRNVTISNSLTSGGSYSSGTFTPTADNSNIRVSTILASLNNGTNVNITTGTTGSQAGNITIQDSINKTGDGDATLSLNAAGNITLNNNKSISSSNDKLNVNFTAGGNILLGNASDITTNGGTVTFNNPGNIVLDNNASISTRGGNVLLKTTGGTIQFNNNSFISTDRPSSSSDGSLTLVAKSFFNSSGTDVFNTGSNRWLVYSVKPADNTTDGLNANFFRYSCTYGGACPTLGEGNGYLYSSTPLLNLTINPNSKTIVYGSAVPSLSYYLSGYQGGDAAIDVVTGAPIITTNYTQGSNIGNYNIITTAGTLVSSLGYGFTGTTLTGGLVVTAKEISASLIGTVSKVYDGTTNATLNSSNYQLTGLYGTDNVSISNTAGQYINKNVGDNKTVTVNGLTLTGDKALNYTLSNTSVSGNIGSISKRVLNVIAGAQNKIYDGNTSATVTLSDNRIEGDAITTNTTSANFNNKNVGNSKTVTVNYSVTGSDSGNYSFSGTTTTLANITKRALNIISSAQNKVYDGNRNANVTLSSDKISGDIVNLNISSANFDTKNVGNGKVVTTNYTLSGADAGNYSVNGTSTTTANITKRNLTVDADGNNKIYDGSADANVRLSDNRVRGDNLRLDYDSAYFVAGKDAGNNKTINVNGISISGTDSGNYNLINSTDSTIADIYKRALLIDAVGVDKVYDGTNVANVILNDNRVEGDVLNTGYSSATYVTGKNVGKNKLITVTGLNIINPSANDGKNYYIANLLNADLAIADITKRALNIIASADDKVYDGNTSATISLSDNRVSGDLLNISSLDANFDNKNVGTDKTVTVSGITVSGADAKNYSIGTDTATATADITKRDLNITSIGENKVYDGNRTAIVNLSDDRIEGDDISSSYIEALFDNKNVGTERTISVTGISIEGDDAGNYNFNDTSETYADITKRDLNVSANSQSKVYGSRDPFLSYSHDALQGEDSAFEVFTGGLSREAGENVADGPYEITQGDLSAGENYNIIFNGSDLTITPYTLIVRADGKTKIYGTIDPTLTYTYGSEIDPILREFSEKEIFNGLQNGDTAEVFSGGLSRQAGERVANGPYAIELGSLSAGPNYNIEFIGADFVITPATLNIAANNQSVLFGGNLPPLTFNIDGLANGDSASALSGSLSTVPTNSLPGVYGIEQGSLVASSDYIINYTPGALTITSPIDQVNSTNIQGILDPIGGGGRNIGRLLSIILNGGGGAFNNTNLANLEPAAGGDDENSDNLENIEPAAGGEDNIVSLLECNKSSLENNPCAIEQ